MKAYILVLIFVTAVVLFSCNSREQQSEAWEEMAGSGSGAGAGYVDAAMVETRAMESKSEFSPPPIEEDGKPGAAPSNTEPGNKSVVNNKKVIKDGSISVKTNDIAESKKRIDGLLKGLHAYYEREDLQNNDQTISYDLKIRVPAHNFEKLVAGVESGGEEVKGKSIQARDVTEEFMDIEARLSSKREFLKRFKDLLARASTVKDILAIEENIRVLQEEIESKEGRLKFLSDQVALSTLDLNVYQEKEFIYKPQPQDKFTERVKKSLSNGWTSVVNFLLGLIAHWPFIILLALVFLGFRRIMRRRRNKQ